MFFYGIPPGFRGHNCAIIATMEIENEFLGVTVEYAIHLYISQRDFVAHLRIIVIGENQQVFRQQDERTLLPDAQVGGLVRQVAGQLVGGVELVDDVAEVQQRLRLDGVVDLSQKFLLEVHIIVFEHRSQERLFFAKLDVLTGRGGVVEGGVEHDDRICQDVCLV